MSTETGASGRSKGIAGVLAVLAGVGLFGLIGARVKEALGERKALAATLGEQAKTETKHAGVQTVHGASKRWRPSIPVTGTLAPVQEADVGFKMGGRLVGVVLNRYRSRIPRWMAPFYVYG